MSDGEAASGETGGEATDSGVQTAALLNGGGDAPAAETPNGGEGDFWYTRFADGLDDDTASAFNGIASQYDSENKFAQGVVELRKSHDNRVAIPDDDGDWGKFYDRLGRPKDFSEYSFPEPTQFALDDMDKASLDNFRPVAHENGLTQKQTEALVNWRYEEEKVQRDAMEARAQSTQETNMKTLRSEWGPQFDENYKNAGLAVRHYAGDAINDLAGLQLADGTMMLDNPQVVRMFAKMGNERSEDFTDVTPMNQGNRVSAQEEIDRLTSEALSNGLSPSHPKWPADKLKALYERAHPG